MFSSGTVARPSRTRARLYELSRSADLGLLECSDVDLGHLQHRFYRAVRLNGIGISYQFTHVGRYYLLRETKLVLQPSAL